MPLSLPRTLNLILEVTSLSEPPRPSHQGEKKETMGSHGQEVSYQYPSMVRLERVTGSLHWSSMLSHKRLAKLPVASCQSECWGDLVTCVPNYIFDILSS